MLSYIALLTDWGTSLDPYFWHPLVHFDENSFHLQRDLLFSLAEIFILALSYHLFLFSVEIAWATTLRNLVDRNC